MAARFRDNCPLDCKVYVGELGNDGSRHELEEAFGYYGPLRNVWVARNPPGFAFVMFEDPRDARDACRALNGKYVQCSACVSIVLFVYCLPLYLHVVRAFRHLTHPSLSICRIICGRRVRVELSSGKTRREMAETTNGRYGPPRDGGRFTPPPRGRSPRRSPPPRGRAGAGDPYHRYDEPFHRGGREAPPRRAMRSR